MDTSTLVWVVVAAVAALIVVGALVLVSQRRLAHSHRRKATTIRDHAAEHVHQVGQREALADEAEANARGMQAQADAKAAVAARLQHGAATRRDEAKTARAEVDEEFVRADELDPDSQPRQAPAQARTTASAGTSSRPNAVNNRAPAEREPTTAGKGPERNPAV
jgi:hypothetical protein